MSHPRRNAKLKLALLLSALALSALACSDVLGVGIGDNGGGGSNELPVADLAGVNAFGTVVQALDGSTHARLDVLTLSGEPRFLSGITSPTLTVSTTQIPLTTGASVGVFTTNSNRASALRYAANTPYRFDFEIIDEAGGVHAYSGVVTAPERAPIVEAATSLVHFVGEPLSLELYHMAQGGSLRVTNAQGTVTFDNTAISSMADITRVRPALEATVGPYEEVPGSAFPAPGRYLIEVTSFNFADSMSGLAATSWFGAGTTSAISISVD